MSPRATRHRRWVTTVLSLGLSVGLMIGLSACSGSSGNIDGTYTGTAVERGTSDQARVTAQLHCTSKTACVFSGTVTDGKSKSPFTYTFTRQRDVLESVKQSAGTATECTSDNSSTLIDATIKGKGFYLVKQDQWVDTSTCTAHQNDLTMHLTRTT